MELIAQYIDDLRRGTVIPGGNLDTALTAGCMDYLAVADVDGYMVYLAAAARIEYQIARTHVA